jgi:hypothetical protein
MSAEGVVQTSVFGFARLNRGLGRGTVGTRAEESYCKGQRENSYVAVPHVMDSSFFA